VRYFLKRISSREYNFVTHDMIICELCDMCSPACRMFSATYLFVTRAIIVRGSFILVRYHNLCHVIYRWFVTHIVGESCKIHRDSRSW